MALLARAAAAVARVASGAGRQALAGPAAQNGATRAMGGAAHHGNPNDYVTYAGLTLKKPATWEYAAGKVIGGTMWFWVFYMAYHEWDHKTRGLPAIFEAEGLDDDDGHGHGHH
ncbi:hypothetical protein HT031_006429 [Scenedesmus sp. PABB004]|nr:hypothetical protein HT031_006429 [Scenedesmus sp. PABB004]